MAFKFVWNGTGGTDTDVNDGLNWDLISIRNQHFDWTDSPPDQEHFETLMIEAVQAIDKWIANQM